MSGATAGDRVQKLHLVGFTTDLDGLILSARKGSRSGSFVVPLDDALVEALVDAVRRRQEASEAGTGSQAGARLAAAVGAGRARPDSSLSVREMQERLRAGASIEEVASEAGVDPEWVARFAPPVLAEQARVVDRAREIFFDKPRVGQSRLPLGDAVARNVLAKGVHLAEDDFETGWSAHLLPGGLWAIRFTYVSRGREQEAVWVLDPDDDELSAGNRLASQLGYAASARARRTAPAKRAAKKASTAPRKKAAAKRSAGRKRAATKKAAAKKAAAKKAATKKAAGKQAAPKKAAPKKAARKKATGRRAAAPKKPAPKKAARKKATGSKKATGRRAAAPKKAAGKKTSGRTAAPRTAKSSTTRRGGRAPRTSSGDRAGGGREAPPAPPTPPAPPSPPRPRPPVAAAPLSAPAGDRPPPVPVPVPVAAPVASPVAAAMPPAPRLAPSASRLVPVVAGEQRPEPPPPRPPAPPVIRADLAGPGGIASDGGRRPAPSSPHEPRRRIRRRREPLRAR